MPLGLHTQQSRPDARPRHARTSACPALTLDASLAAGHGLSRPKAIRPAALAAAGGRAAARRRRRTGAAHVAGGRRRARSGQAPELHAADLKLLAAHQHGLPNVSLSPLPPQARPQARLQSSTRPTSNSSLPARHGLPNVSLAPLLPNARSPSRQSAYAGAPPSAMQSGRPNWKKSLRTTRMRFWCQRQNAARGCASRCSGQHA